MSSTDTSPDRTGTATTLRHIAAATDHSLNLDNLIIEATQDPTGIVSWITAAAEYATACYADELLRGAIILLQQSITGYAPDAVAGPLGLLCDAVRQREQFAVKRATARRAFERLSHNLDPDLVHPTPQADVTPAPPPR